MNNRGSYAVTTRSWHEGDSVERHNFDLPRGSFNVPSVRGTYLQRSHQSILARVDYALICGRNAAKATRLSVAKAVQQTVEKTTEAIRGHLALLIAAHNEEVVIGDTISSAIAAGQKPEDIYVVDDNSTDATSEVACKYLPESNVVKVDRSGKGLALTKAGQKFQLSDRYDWIHIADADGAFSHDYFAKFNDELDPANAAATGYVRSLPGKNVSQYRLFEYTIGMEVHRRFQDMFNVIPIIPGPTSCFRNDVFAKVNFANQAIAEDFDVTLQIHRNKLGKIQFIPGAIAYTQDPATVKNFRKQITRWNRGVLQGIVRHKVGRQMTRLDAYLMYQVMQNLLFFFNFFVWLPILIAREHSASVLATVFLYDVIVTMLMSLLVAVRTKRADLISAFPIVYALRWVSLYVFLKSFVEIIILRRFRITTGTWEHDTGYRYVMPA